MASGCRHRHEDPSRLYHNQVQRKWTLLKIFIVTTWVVLEGQVCTELKREKAEKGSVKTEADDNAVEDVLREEEDA